MICRNCGQKLTLAQEAQRVCSEDCLEEAQAKQSSGRYQPCKTCQKLYLPGTLQTTAEFCSPPCTPAPQTSPEEKSKVIAESTMSFNLFLAVYEIQASLRTLHHAWQTNPILQQQADSLAQLSQSVASEKTLTHLIETLGTVQQSLKMLDESQRQDLHEVRDALQQLPFEALGQVVTHMSEALIKQFEGLHVHHAQAREQMVAVATQLEGLKQLDASVQALGPLLERPELSQTLSQMQKTLASLPATLAASKQASEAVLATAVAETLKGTQDLVTKLDERLIKLAQVITQGLNTTSLQVSNLQDPHGIKINQTSPNFYTANRPFDIQLAYSPTLTNDAEYVGRAEPGTAQTTAAWQIQKIYYASAGLPSGVVWANGSTAFNVAWSAREGLAYS